MEEIANCLNKLGCASPGILKYRKSDKAPTTSAAHLHPQNKWADVLFQKLLGA